MQLLKKFVRVIIIIPTYPIDIIYCEKKLTGFNMTERRASVSDTIKMSLLCEVQGLCPLCKRALITKAAGKKIVRVFDVAHIYPLNATEHEKKILAGEELLTDDIDSEQNLIALCKICHKIYDTKKTTEEYRRLVYIKRQIEKNKDVLEIWDKQTLHKDICRVASTIGAMKASEIKETELSLSALKVSDKTDESFDVINLIKVNAFVLKYFVPIRESLKLLESEEKAKSDFICIQVKSFYLILKMKNYSQNDIFEKMCEWFMTNTGINERSKAEVLVSYFIQNCEVFS